MIKLAAPARKKEGLSRDALRDGRIRSRASPARRIAGMRGYRIDAAGSL